MKIIKQSICKGRQYMRTLLVGNTGYITNKFVEEAFPESLVMVMGDTNIRKNRKKNLFVRPFVKNEKELEDMLNAVTNATEIMSRRKIGALMVFERETGLEERIETGVPIDGLISDSLLLNIFEPDTPLHDGAVVIRGNRIVAASCLLPLTEARNLSQELGTRHRSAIGISEQSDALVLVVSEETGTISLARNGELHRYLTGEDIKSLLRAAVVQPSLNWKQVINDKIKEIRGGK